jgi:hypothetical protein
MTCQNKIHYLPPKYNATYAIRAKGAEKWPLFTKEALSEKPIVYHFTAAKPWNAKYMKQADVWWNFVQKHSNLYDDYLNNYKKQNTFAVKFNRLKHRILSKLNRIIRKN